jgi:hypothetical protein
MNIFSNVPMSLLQRNKSLNILHIEDGQTANYTAQSLGIIADYQSLHGVTEEVEQRVLWRNAANFLGENIANNRPAAGYNEFRTEYLCPPLAKCPRATPSPGTCFYWPLPMVCCPIAGKAKLERRFFCKLGGNADGSFGRCCLAY